jgi:hypothetical protein
VYKTSSKTRPTRKTPLPTMKGICLWGNATPVNPETVLPTKSAPKISNPRQTKSRTRLNQSKA